MKKFFVIAAMVMGTMVVANAEGTTTKPANGDNESTVVNKKSPKKSVYGTWQAKVNHGTETVTVVMTPHAMTITKIEKDGDAETEYYNTFKYNSATGKIKAHQYKEVTIDNGVKKEDNEGSFETYYVKWVDKDHIQLGSHPDKMDSDFGVLARK